MKRITSLVLLILIGCSENVQKFDCDGTGLVISKSKAIYGDRELHLCSKNGIELTFYEKGKKCDSTDPNIPSITFDEVTYKLETWNYYSTLLFKNSVTGENIMSNTKTFRCEKT